MTKSHPEKLTRIHAHATARQLAALKKESGRTHIPVAALVRIAIDIYLKRLAK